MPQPYVFRGNDGEGGRREGGRSGRDRDHRRDGRRRGGRPHHEFTFRATPSSRPLLMAKRETTPDFMGGPDSDAPAKKFMAPEDLTDSDETEMDVSTTTVDEQENDDGTAQPPRKKRAIERDSGAAAPPAPKWSNPDPYTVLPPEEERQGKRRDFVKLIRKARITPAVTSTPEVSSNPAVTNDDFISLGVDEPDDMPPEGAPSGPRAAELERSDSALGNRKRNRDDEITGPAVRRGKKGSKFFNLDGSPLDIWKPLDGQDPTPWFDRSGAAFHIGTMLHKEILDFYHWVKPTEYEDIVRRDLISRLQACFGQRFYGAKLYAFGSFASGLYLPTADMDLVLLSRQFMSSNRKYICQKVREIYSFAEYIRGQGIAVPRSIETIAHARVPIIKFVDALTGLKVDLSFDNSSGLTAIDTFKAWKQEYPAMPVIASIIKHFLLIRGLNDVATGGLGGFSIICLVTSILQHSPRGVGESNLGSVLIDFFEMYGSRFDPAAVGIQFDPPGYFNKAARGIYNANKGTRLSIIDPNNPDNDISGGTKEIPLIFLTFYDAYQSLKEGLYAASCRPCHSPSSLLGTIIGGNYDAYEEQRKHLRDFFLNEHRFAGYRATVGLGSPPPPPPLSSPSPPPPPPHTG
ncbi:topoisomerase TRF4 [Trichophyton rubrum]|uniref:polynucleotide adenylyltransferase n=1 Tax=Trichophyton rubrum TaxID=5551 RepID=A0A178ET93_TRIRU|nr:PAP/25A-associated [Trichophyton rubrum]OAL63281.1 topoisomerase TRF4 [Trichophyton rubrum]